MTVNLILLFYYLSHSEHHMLLVFSEQSSVQFALILIKYVNMYMVFMINIQLHIYFISLKDTHKISYKVLWGQFKYWSIIMYNERDTRFIKNISLHIRLKI